MCRKKRKAKAQVKSRKACFKVYFTFTDTSPAQGTNYYRLKQMDFEGTTEYTKIVVVKNSEAINFLARYFYTLFIL